MLDDWEYSLHNLEMLSYKNLFCFVPLDATQTMKKDFKAVLAKNFMGYSSIDYIHRKIFKEDSIIENKNPYYNLLINLQSTIWQIISELKERRNRLKLKEETVITLEITSSFIRLENSFESIMFLIYNKFYFESMSINRLIFEQLNYCFNLIQLTPDEFNNLSVSQTKKILSPTNISKIKRHFNSTDIANFYSTLCNLTHIGLNGAKEYITFNPDDSEYYVTMRSIKQAITAAIYLLYNADLFGLVFEYCFHDKSDLDLHFMKNENGILQPNTERNTVKQYYSFIDDFDKLLREVEIPNKSRKNTYEDFEENDLPF